MQEPARTLSPQQRSANEAPLIFFGNEAAFVVVRLPLTCPECHQAHFFLVNRNGRTFCAVCDAKRGGGQ